MSVFKDILDTIGSIEGEVDSMISSTRFQKSLSKSAQEGVLDFPVIVSDSLSVEDAGLVSKALEKNFASFVLVVMTMNPYLSTRTNPNASKYIQKFHQNVDVKGDATDIVNTVTSFMEQASAKLGIDYEKLGDVCENIVYNIYEGVNSQGLNAEQMKYNYTVEEVADPRIINTFNTYAMEASKPSSSGSTSGGGSNGGNGGGSNGGSGGGSNNGSGNGNGGGSGNGSNGGGGSNGGSGGGSNGRGNGGPRTRGTRRPHNPGGGGNNNNNNIPDRIRQDVYVHNGGRNNLQRSGNNYLQSRDAQFIMSNDYKKANELVPTLIHIRIFPYDPMSNDQFDPIDFVLGVKATLHPVTSDEMIVNIVRGIKNDNMAFNFIRWTTGEIRFFKDFLFTMNDLKIDAVNTSAKTSKWWTMLKRRKALARIKNVILPNKLLPNATIVITQEEVETIREQYGYDISKESMIFKLMDAYFLIAFVIVDPALQRVKFLFDGKTEFETLTYATLARESTTDDRQFKEMLNMLGRRI